ncbi:WD40-repeat-containing domain protein [Lipomyces arxii]|uniref:WD40-repeat-containing domain protein n=1 Tax=Lipomyces arxii TaxID=56418 RepID=UPI0034CDDB19
MAAAASWTEDVMESLQLNLGVDPVCRLPEELMAKILSRVDLQSLWRCLQVSRAWNTVAMSNPVWLAQFQSRRKWKAKQQRVEGLNWKKMFTTRHQLDVHWKQGQAKTMMLNGHTESVYCLQFDDEKIVTGSRDRTVRVWSTKTGELLKTLEENQPSNGEKIGGHLGSVLCLIYDNHLMVSGSSDTTCIVWSLPEFKATHRLRHHTSRVLDCTMNDRFIVSCSKDGTIGILDKKVADYPLLRIIQACQGSLNAIHMQRNLIASAGVDRVVRLWHAETGKGLTSFHGHTRGLACVQISPDMRIVVSGGNDNTIRVWDVWHRQCVRVFTAHQGLVRSLHINGHKLISGSYDKTIKVWDLDSLTLTMDLDQFHSAWILTAKTNGKMIVSSSFGPTPVVLDFTTGLDPRYMNLIEY